MAEVVPKNENACRFTTQRAAAVAALLQCASLAQAAQTTGISVRTLRRWRAQPAFAEALAQAQAEILFAVCNELRSLGTVAVQTLAKTMRDPKAPAAAKVRASIAVVNLLLKAHHSEVVELRLVRLEAKDKTKKLNGGTSWQM